MKRVIFPAAVLVAVLVSGPVAAEAAGNETYMRAVSIADLDLGSAEGREELDRRIHVATFHACGMASSTDLAGSNAVRKCRKDLARSVAVQRRVAVAGRKASLAYNR